MYEQVEKPKENKSRAVANSFTQKKSDGKQGFGFVDNRKKTFAYNGKSNSGTGRVLQGWFPMTKHDVDDNGVTHDSKDTIVNDMWLKVKPTNTTVISSGTMQEAIINGFKEMEISEKAYDRDKAVGFACENYYKVANDSDDTYIHRMKTTSLEDSVEKHFGAENAKNIIGQNKVGGSDFANVSSVIQQNFERMAKGIQASKSGIPKAELEKLVFTAENAIRQLSLESIKHASAARKKDTKLGGEIASTKLWWSIGVFSTMALVGILTTLFKILENAGVLFEMGGKVTTVTRGNESETRAHTETSDLAVGAQIMHGTQLVVTTSLGLVAMWLAYKSLKFDEAQTAAPGLSGNGRTSEENSNTVKTLLEMIKTQVDHLTAAGHVK